MEGLLRKSPTYNWHDNQATHVTMNECCVTAQHCVSALLTKLMFRKTPFGRLLLLVVA